MVDNNKQTRINSTNLFIDEYGNNNDIHSTVTSNSTRAYSSPLMGTSARAAKHRVNTTDTSNQSPQYLYQNTQDILNEQTSNGTKQESRQPPVTYDTPPRNQQQQQVQKVITKITTTTTTNSPTQQHNQSNSLPKESSTSMTPVNRLLEQAVETQRLANNNLPSPPPTTTTTTTTTSNDSSKPIIFERTDQYRVVLDPANGEIRRTPSIPVGKTGHSTDIDQAQEQANRFVDDHQAIQQLTRVLQEHNTTTVNEYHQRLSSQASPILINTTTTTTTTTLPSTVVPVTPIDKTNQFSVIDALLDNPLGTTNSKQNQTLHARFNDILKNLKNSDYVNALKQSATKITKKKPTKKSTNVTLVDKEIQLNESMMDPNAISSDQTILIPSNKKKKSKKSPANINYQVLDALISSPVSLRLPESYLTKYKVNPPLTQLSLASSTTDIHKTNNLPLSQQGNIKAKYDTVNNLDNVVNEIRLHGQQMSTIRPTSLERSNQPKLVYGYMDEQDIVLKISPSTSRDMPNNNRSRRIEPTYFNNRHLLPEHEQHITWHNESKLPTTITCEDLELRDKRIPQINERTIPISYEYQYPIKISTPLYSNQDNVQLKRLPLSYYLDRPYNSNKTVDYESESSDSDDQSTVYHSYKQIPLSNQSHSPNRPLFHRTHSSNRSPPPPPLPCLARPFRDISPDLPINNVSRNYIEVFRDGENRPSEVYSLLFNESVPFNQRHSRLDQYNSDRYQRKYHQSSSPIRKSPNIIPIKSTNDEYRQQNNSEFNNYLRQSKSFDYRPLRLKLQREYRITPSLLVDEWEQQPIESTSTNSNMKTSLSSPDDVFITSNNNKRKI